MWANSANVSAWQALSFCLGSGLYLRTLWGEKFHSLPSDAGLRASLQAQDPGKLYQELLELDPKRAKELHPNDTFRVCRALEIVKLTGKAVADSLQA